MRDQSRKISPLAVCLGIVAACGGSAAGGSTETTAQPTAGSTGGSKGTMQPAAAGKSAGGSSGGAGGMAGAKAGAAGNSGAGGTAGESSPANAPPTAVAMIMSFKAAAPAMGAAGSGSGAGFAVVYGQASFTKLSSTEVDVEVEVMGCDNGKSYPVHIHEGTSCDSVMSQGGHWGATVQSAAGSGGSSAAAGSGGTTGMLRGEGIPDIKCTGTTGVAAGKRDTTDENLLWTIGTMDGTDVVGHVIVVHDGADRIACGKIELKK